MRTRRSIPHFLKKDCGFLLMLVLAGAAVGRCNASESDEWREKMEPIVPQSYLCRHTTTPILVDGKPDDAAWAEAPWTSNFVDILPPSP
ncbi:MAG TPA: hypothetical protein VMQ67_03375, partial [Candidatus Saccharimonadales bacterium]|nr:hypothetical protein [Candidatus Saccharimonadales bacterium]